MMYDYDIYTFLKRMYDEGMQVWYENGKIKYRSKENAPIDVNLQKLKDNKEILIKWFNKYSKEKLPLTPLQQAYLIGEDANCELGNINAHYYIEYECSKIDVSRMETVINQVIKKNDALRMVVLTEGFTYFFDEVPYYTLTECKTDDFQIRENMSHNLYKIGEWPMFKFLVNHRKDGMDVLHVSFDCIILDAWSAKEMMNQIFDLYNGKELFHSNYTFKEYLRNIKCYLNNSKQNNEAKEYWNASAPLMPPAPHLKQICGYSDIKQPYFNRIEYSFTKEETEKLYSMSRRNYFTPTAVICSVFLKTLSGFSDNKDITIDLTLYNRIPLNNNIDKVLGEFTNIGLISYYFDDGLVFEKEIRLIQKQFWKLLQYREYDGTKILPQLASYSMNSAVMPIVYTSMLTGNVKTEMKNRNFREIYSISQTPQVAIDHHVRDDLGYLKLSWDYVKGLFDERYIRQIFKKYISTIKNVLRSESWDISVI